MFFFSKKMLHLGNFIYFCTLKGVHNGLNREPGESPGQFPLL